MNRAHVTLTTFFIAAAFAFATSIGITAETYASYMDVAVSSNYGSYGDDAGIGLINQKTMIYYTFNEASVSNAVDAYSSTFGPSSLYFDFRSNSYNGTVSASLSNGAQTKISGSIADFARWTNTGYVTVDFMIKFLEDPYDTFLAEGQVGQDKRRYIYYDYVTLT